MSEAADVTEVEVIEFRELEDGSAVVTIVLCDEASKLLMGAGLRALLMQHLQEVEAQEQADEA